MEWYRIDAHEAFARLNTSSDGLTNAEAEARLEQYGPNALMEEEGVSKLDIVLDQFRSPLIYILLIAAFVTVLLQEYIDAAVIMAVVIINAIIGFIQEYKAEEALEALKKRTVATATVLRDHHERVIDGSKLVPGDVILLRSGDRVPADVRLFQTIELRVEEAMLTGESVPVEKRPDSIDAEGLTAGDQLNMGFAGTTVVSGRGRALVVETGAHTQIGRIATSVAQQGRTVTPLQAKIHHFARLIGVVVLISAAAVVAVGIYLGMDLVEVVLAAIAITVSAIPEGLPIVVTVTMAVGVSRMAAKNAIIRKLPAVETLGSTTVIASDKTGTLTKNEMTVRLVYDGLHTYELTGDGYEPNGTILLEGEPVDVSRSPNLEMLLRIGMLCTESAIYEEDEQFKVSGDPLEGALIVAAMKGGLEEARELEQFQHIATLPFESERGYMATLHRHRDCDYIFIKGAPERLLEIYEERSDLDELCPMDLVVNAPTPEDILRVAHAYADQGMRVLAMAYKEAPPGLTTLSEADVAGRLVFAGLQGTMDPPRAEASVAVQEVKRAGIRVVMITGDHIGTARSIASRIGIGDGAPVAITGRELDDMSDYEFEHRLKEIDVFARVSPEHKLRVVQELVRHGEVVAVTGDGVNDAPALKAAHIGVAMGRTGTDAAKGAADMVVTDDNFASIFEAVREGRTVFENIRKVTLFLIPTGLAEIVTILASMLAGLPIPYVPAQILWLNLVTNGIQDIALAFEPGEEDVVHRPPRPQREGIVSRLMVERGALVALVLAVATMYTYTNALSQGYELERARTIALTTMVFMQFFQAWNSRSERKSVFQMNPLSNPMLFYATIGAFAVHLAAVYVPAFQFVLRTAPLAAEDWIRIAIVSVSVLVVVELDKLIRRRFARPAR